MIFGGGLGMVRRVWVSSWVWKVDVKVSFGDGE